MLGLKSGLSLGSTVGGAFHPPSIPDPVGFWTPSVGNVFTDTAGTTPAAHGDPVGRLSGIGGALTAPSDAARPILNVLDGKSYITSDGVDDVMQLAAPISYKTVMIYFRDTNTGGGNSAIMSDGSAGSFIHATSANNLSIDGSVDDLGRARVNDSAWTSAARDGENFSVPGADWRTSAQVLTVEFASDVDVLELLRFGSTYGALEVYAVVLFDRYLTDAEQEIVRNEMQA